MFFGSIVALVTPMKANGAIDEERFQHLLELHIAEGTNAIVIAGSTGEGALLSPLETVRCIRLAVKTARGRVPIIAGTSGISTRDTLKNTEQAMQQGVDACLIATPAYVKPTQLGLYNHFQSIAQALPVPIVLYNVPSRTHCDLLPSTVAELADIPNIVGLKETVVDEMRLSALAQLCHQKIDIFSGEDKSALNFLRQGGKGVISVTANVAPRLMAHLCHLVRNQEFQAAEQLDARLQLLHAALGLETNPIPVKWALKQMGLIEGHLRLPLTPLSLLHQGTLKDALHKSQLLPELQEDLVCSKEL